MIYSDAVRQDRGELERIRECIFQDRHLKSEFLLEALDLTDNNNDHC